MQYDGVLKRYSADYLSAVLHPDVENALFKLAADEKNHIYVSSRRAADVLDQLFKDIPNIGLL